MTTPIIHRMLAYLLPVLATMLVACAGQPATTQRADHMYASPPPSTDEAGATVARHLQERYDERTADCGNSVRPSFLCSGILMRSTEYSPTYHSWVPNPSTASWGVSFSWLRADSNFSENYPSGNGFIVLPWFYADDQPGRYDQLLVRCIYPQDAWTTSPDRCRTVCQSQGVTTAAQWLARFTDNADQCAFDVAQGSGATADAWNQVTLIRSNPTRPMFVRNEVIVQAWSQGVGARMPLEAFFYRDNCFVTDKRNGGQRIARDEINACTIPGTIDARRLDAGRDQIDFENATGIWVPVIRWTPATTMGGRATFTFNPGDQMTRR